MKSNKKIIALIFTGLILTFAGTTFLKNDKKVINIVQEEPDNSDIEIVEGDNYIKILSKIKDVDDIRWIDENTVEFRGKDIDSNNQNDYIFDYKSKNLSIKADVEIDKSFLNNIKGEITLIEKIGEKNYLVNIEKGQNQGLIYIKNNKEIKKISDSIIYKDKLKFKLSPNYKKVTFYDKNDNKIKIFDFKEEETVELEQEINESLLVNFRQSLSFSPDEGYIAISYFNKDTLGDSYFNVFGADSGKIYGEKILGLNPVWANTNLRVAYMYIGDNAKIYEANNDTRLAGNQVGIFNLRTRRMKYTQALKHSVIMESILWSNDDTKLLFPVGETSKDNSTYSFKGLYEYDISNNLLVDHNEYFDKYISKSNNFEISLLENDWLIFIDSEMDKNLIKVINLKNRVIKTYRNIKPFMTKKNNRFVEKKYKQLGQDSFIYVNNNSLYISDIKSNYLKYKTDGIIEQIYESKDKSKVFIVTSLKDKVEFAIINL